MSALSRRLKQVAAETEKLHGRRPPRPRHFQQQTFGRRNLLLGSVAALAACVLMPPVAFAALPPTLRTFPIKFYGAKGDGRIGPSGCSITSGTPNLTGGSGFTAADVGKLILVSGAGAGGTQPLSTTILAVVSSSALTLNANAITTVTGTGGVWLGSDDTAAINAATAAANVKGGVVSCDLGIYCTSSAINMANKIGVTFMGVGKQSGTGPTMFGSHFWNMSNSGHVIDFSGSSHCSLRNFQIGLNLPNTPVCGIFIAGWGGQESVQLELHDVLVTGSGGYGASALYGFGCPQTHVRNCQFYSYLNQSQCAAADINTSNHLSLSSTFGTVNVAASGLDTSQWQFDNVDFFSRGNSAGHENGNALRLDGVSNFLAVNCNIGSTNSCVLVADSVAARGSKHVVFKNCVMARAYATASNNYAVNFATTNTAAVNGFMLDNCVYVDDGTTNGPGTSVVQITPNPAGLINGLMILGFPVTGGAALINGGGGAAVAGDGWLIEAAGNAINEPGSIVRSTYIGSGTVTPQAGATSARYGRVIEKAGSAAGNYTIASTTVADVDATNLALTTIIPAGMGLLVTARAAILNGTAGDGVLLVIADGTTSLEQQDITSPAAGQILPCFIQKLIAGDDASHTIKMRWNAITAGTATMRNSNAPEAPKMEFQYVRLG